METKTEFKISFDFKAGDMIEFTNGWKTMSTVEQHKGVTTVTFDDGTSWSLRGGFSTHLVRTAV